MAEIVSTPDGEVPRGTGWYVLNAKRARWQHMAGFGGSDLSFQGDERFEELGFHLGVLQPGEPASMYHVEDHQEGFLVLAGQCLAIVDGEEVLLEPWDYFHCPPGTPHVLVGAGEAPCLVVAAGGRRPRAGLRVAALGEAQACRPHSVLPLPAQRPSRPAPGLVQCVHPIAA
jgi:uncharacterized cupin superfamily protein